MGEQRIQQQKDNGEIRVFLRNLLKDVHALEWMFEHGMIESGARRIGAEQELFLVDRVWRANPAALAIPCHRVLPASGGAGGYRWGATRKKRLLEQERREGG